MGKVNIIREFKGGSMARTFLVEKYGQLYVRKIVENKGSLGAQKLMSQWRWLFDFCRNEPGVFPDTSFFVTTQGTSYYDMEYVELDTLRDLLVKNERFMIGSIHELVRLGSLIAEKVEQNNDESIESYSYILNKHLYKMIDRNKDIVTYDFFKSDTIFINGKEYMNFKPLLEKIMNNNGLLELLRPKAMYRSHGDLTFQNALADEEYSDSIVIIDPRGEGPDSIYYDISKLFQSCHGKYDLLYEGNYEVYNVNGSAIDFNFKILNHVEKFDLIYKELLEIIPLYYNDLDPNWQLITKFYEASHFLSMTPFRLKENPQITVICYLIGIIIMNEVLEEWENVNSRTIKTSKVEESLVN